MNKMFITYRGRKNIEEKIILQKQIIIEIQKEKEIAYNCSGDGWHDNPGFNNLMQAEERAIADLKKYESDLANSLVYEKVNNNNENIFIGTIVKFCVHYLATKKIKDFVYEIVGNNESDINNNLLSYNSPLGLILIKMKKGEVKDAVIPIGKIRVNIIDVYDNWQQIRN